MFAQLLTTIIILSIVLLISKKKKPQYGVSPLFNVCKNIDITNKIIENMEKQVMGAWLDYDADSNKTYASVFFPKEKIENFEFKPVCFNKDTYEWSEFNMIKEMKE